MGMMQGTENREEVAVDAMGVMYHIEERFGDLLRMEIRDHAITKMRLQHEQAKGSLWQQRCSELEQQIAKDVAESNGKADPLTAEEAQEVAESMIAEMEGTP